MNTVCDGVFGWQVGEFSLATEGLEAFFVVKPAATKFCMTFVVNPFRDVRADDASDMLDHLKAVTTNNTRSPLSWLEASRSS